MTITTGIRQYAAVALLVILGAGATHGQWLVPPTSANQVAVTVTPTVTFDAASGLYTYAYSLTSRPTSVQNVVGFALRVVSQGNPRPSPAGWESREWESEPIVSWAATEATPDPPGFVDDGSLPLAARSIRPGNTLNGFRFVSPDPPGTVTFYVQGETPLPVLAPGFDADDFPQSLFDRSITVNSAVGSTIGPVPINPPDFFEGGRRPAVDGFLVFMNLADGDTKGSPVGIVIKFGVRGETVDASTFTATLNGIDVTSSFVGGAGSGGDVVGLFTAGSSPLTLGRNVLITGVDGIVPGTTRTARDVDRMTFTVK